ncbi:hypothetical protein BDP81DRAFT_443725 [Colletotrichum phormii]|uniref:Calcium-independent phospholipase A2-gamma n=1 Tax=Colletotrichum phormii TaxID=359342 RepID=A0AAI9ZBU8_9PEZI|nr:uncharacterized protein BDP81DRAFT_443725 [Colletotrichum phormii]KAK1613532.1 hypothetical protein BDP81DRAFT_443725 [Colletotrichum phormii]
MAESEADGQGGAVDRCVECKSKSKKLSVCTDCSNSLFCDDCWDQWRLHGPKAPPNVTRPHEKSFPRIIQRLRQILKPDRTNETYEQELEADNNTTWFGVGRDESKPNTFQDYGRFAALLSQSQASTQEEFYPRLVAFIGQTGEGKSTLIKMLINRIETRQKGIEHASPVTAWSDNSATTGDVHLYADPESFHTREPMLYADCEGINGGELPPRALRQTLGQDGSTNAASGNRTRGSSISHCVRVLKRSVHGSQRDITWAKGSAMNVRVHAVTRLYPRLLYTFSDVVVFVSQSPGTFEATIVTSLLSWGKSSIDKSLNQPTLPHAVVVLNATEPASDDEWDVDTATSCLMETVRQAVFRNADFRKHAEAMRSTGKKIETTQDLLECYYASISVIRIPNGRQPRLLLKQVQSLHDLLGLKCGESFMSKDRVRMLATADQLQTYLHSAFDHFSQNRDQPFNFLKDALKQRPVPRDFDGYVVDLAASISRNSTTNFSSERFNTARILGTMVPMIASCVMLDTARQRRPGLASRLLDDVYVKFFRTALDTFVERYVQCSYSETQHGECCNLRSGHNLKGHQNSAGKMFRSGDYVAEEGITQFETEWIEQIRDKLTELENALMRSVVDADNGLGEQQTEDCVAATIHQEQVASFFSTLGNVQSFVSHSTCFCCLREIPEHALPCGHVLCAPCVKAYAAPESESYMRMTTCPFHPKDSFKFQGAGWTVAIKPPFAGARVLSLDGGGVRGIVELQVLKAIQSKLGSGLPIRLFFDLIVGTSTGGIIALGLGVNNWSVDECIRVFKTLCEKAFVRRELVGVPILGQLSVANHGSKYKTKPFEALLQDQFQKDRLLFGGNVCCDSMDTKVAITSTATLVRQQAVVLANYRRLGPEGHDYRLVRANRPEQEFKVWEAARATSAAPPYFETFPRPETKDTYVDGALYHNCPVFVAHHERRMIWPDIADSVPDILLSIGTGLKQPTDVDAGDLILRNSARRRSPNWISRIMEFGTILFDRVDRILDGEVTWNEFVAEVVESRYPSSRNRHIRINPNLGCAIPPLDAVKDVEILEQDAERYMKEIDPKIYEVAHRLIASSFYFVMEPNSVKLTAEGSQCEGFIRCRIPNAHDYMKSLGRLIANCLVHDFEPHFSIVEVGDNSSGAQVVNFSRQIEDMQRLNHFDEIPIRVVSTRESSATMINLHLQSTPYPASASGLPISGFPRELMHAKRPFQFRSERPSSYSQPSRSGPSTPSCQS